MQQTRLKQVRQGGDLELSGEITNYDAINKGIGSDGYSTMAELRMTVNVRFVNNANHAEDFDNLSSQPAVNMMPASSFLPCRKNWSIR